MNTQLQVGYYQSLITCCAMALMFVGSLYVYRSSHYLDRDHPSTIRHRAIAISGVCLLSTIMTMAWTQTTTNDDQTDKEDASSLFLFFSCLSFVLRVTGYRSCGLLSGLIFPLLTAMTLFAGPMAVHVLRASRQVDDEDEDFKRREAFYYAVNKPSLANRVLSTLSPTSGDNHHPAPSSSFSSMSSAPVPPFTLPAHISLPFGSSFLPHAYRVLLRLSLLLSSAWSPYGNVRLLSLRNYVIAPLCEEHVFRGCMIPLLLAGGHSVSVTVVVVPALFGVAHVHHLVEYVRTKGYSMKQGCMLVGFQLFYTTVFGMLASFLFIRTGQLVGVFLVHSFCNMMGFPDLGWIANINHEVFHKRKLVGIIYLVGILSFIVFLYPLSSPSLYGSEHLFQIKIDDNLTAHQL